MEESKELVFEEEKLYNIKETSKITGLSTAAIHSHIRKGMFIEEDFEMVGMRRKLKGNAIKRVYKVNS